MPATFQIDIFDAQTWQSYGALFIDYRPETLRHYNKNYYWKNCPHGNDSGTWRYRRRKNLTEIELSSSHSGQLVMAKISSRAWDRPFLPMIVPFVGALMDHDLEYYGLDGQQFILCSWELK